MEAGATPIHPLGEAVYRDRCGYVRDPFGHIWGLAQAVETLTPSSSPREWTRSTGDPRPARGIGTPGLTFDMLKADPESG